MGIRLEGSGAMGAQSQGVTRHRAPCGRPVCRARSQQLATWAPSLSADSIIDKVDAERHCRHRRSVRAARGAPSGAGAERVRPGVGRTRAPSQRRQRRQRRLSGRRFSSSLSCINRAPLLECHSTAARAPSVRQRRRAASISSGYPLNGGARPSER